MHIKKRSNDSPNFPHVVSGLTLYFKNILYYGVMTIRVKALQYFFMYLLSSIFTN